MDPQRKQKIKEVMLNHLKSLGWPNVPDPDALAFSQAEKMFELLCRENLVKYIDWENYYMAAIREYEKAQLRKMGVPI